MGLLPTGAHNVRVVGSCAGRPILSIAVETRGICPCITPRLGWSYASGERESTPPASSNISSLLRTSRCQCFELMLDSWASFSRAPQNAASMPSSRSGTVSPRWGNSRLRLFTNLSCGESRKQASWSANPQSRYLKLKPALSRQDWRTSCRRSCCLLSSKWAVQVEITSDRTRVPVRDQSVRRLVGIGPAVVPLG